MDESNSNTVSATSGCGPSKPQPRSLCRRNGGSHVRHTQGDMVDALPPMIEESRERAVSGKRLHKLHFCLPHRKK